IGRPLTNMKAYVLDAEKRLMPIGCVGELYIGGLGVGRGYINRDEETQLRFVANPFVPGSRLYRTGDRVCRLENGEIEYLGRLDNQVKVNGFRIELEEIEAVLLDHGDVQAAVVAVREEKVGQRLVAYIVPKEFVPTKEELKNYLGEKVPAYMVPSQYIVLKAMPLTVNGKIDRKALPKIEENDKGHHEIVLPRTEIEEKIANIWCSVLKLDKI